MPVYLLLPRTHMDSRELRSVRVLGCLPPEAWQVPEAAAGQFGFPVDNTIGGTEQPNGWMSSWIDFYRERRLKHMLNLVGGWVGGWVQAGTLIRLPSGWRAGTAFFDGAFFWGGGVAGMISLLQPLQGGDCMVEEQLPSIAAILPASRWA